MSNDSTKTGRHRDQAYSHFRASRFALAEPLCHEVLANQPANPTALLMLGMICIELNRPGDARKWLHKAYDNAPAIPRYPGRLANGLMHAGLLEQAAGRQKIRHKLEPYKEAVLINIGIILIMQGRHREAINILETVIDANPRSTEALLNIGTSYQLQGRYEQAGKYYRRVLDLHHGHETASVKLGEVLQLENRCDDAIGIYQNAISITPESSSLFFGLYIATFERQSTAESIELLHKAVTSDPAHINSRTHLGILHDIHGNTDRANQQFEYVGEHAPEYVFGVESWDYARERIGPGKKYLP